MHDARQAAEFAARNSYSRLLAYLVAQTQDVAAAEDALGDAFLAALRTWTEKGIPPHPDAWLLLTAKRKLIDKNRRQQSQAKALHIMGLAESVAGAAALGDEVTFPDERLKLLFVCAHPAIDASMHTPLMLQTVLGLNASQIASAFLISPTAMGQRLVRAKTKIRDAGIPFEVPAAQDLPTRLAAVLAAIYAAYNQGWEGRSESDACPRELTQEALWLARLCVDLLPNEAEAEGLLALILYCESRQAARRQAGAYVPLSQQKPALWSMAMIQEAEQLLSQAADRQQWGRFQLEAAIQSIHAQRVRGREVDWEAIALLYAGLIQRYPTLGALVSQAAAIAQARDCQTGLSALLALPEESIKNYQPYWALKAYLYAQLKQHSEAEAAYHRAIGLSEDAAVRVFLLNQVANLKGRA